jgi:predicted nucleotidyltransferase
MFTLADRDRVRDRVLQLARNDTRVTAGALVGSAALGDEDRWSDLDLTFAVPDNLSLFEVLEEWTQTLARDFQAAQLFDLPSGGSIYRVFLLPDCLQLDLSFTPASQFGAIGPKFKLLFGSAVEKAHIEPSAERELFGYAVHHALRGRICIERGRCWQAEYWISGARDYVLSLACRRRGLSPSHGRAFDDLPSDLRARMSKALPTSFEPDALFAALRTIVEELLTEASELQKIGERIGPILRELLEPRKSR